MNDFMNNGIPVAKPKARRTTASVLGKVIAAVVIGSALALVLTGVVLALVSMWRVIL